MIRVSPPRHQGHQVHPTTPFNAKTQRRKGAKPTHPPINAETRRRRGAEGISQDFSVWRGDRSSKDVRAPLGRESVPKTSFRTGFPTQRLALRKRKPRHLSSSFMGWTRHALSPLFEKEERQNRRACGTAAWENSANDESSLSEAAGFSQVTGDPIACCSASIPPSTSLAQLETLCAFASLRGGRTGGLCVLCGSNSGLPASPRFLGRAGPEGPAYRRLRETGWVGALRLCASASLRFFLRDPLVSWCLGGFSFSQPTRNSS
jgi:hypothetical protein